MLAAIFDSITASAEGMDRLEPLRGLTSLHRRCDPEAVRLATERKTGLERAIRRRTRSARCAFPAAGSTWCAAPHDRSGCSASFAGRMQASGVNPHR
jgi:hypothetical protein